jgi:hypothetical protein
MKKSFEMELENSLKLDQLEQRLEMWYCCAGGSCGLCCGTGDPTYPVEGFCENPN